MSWNPAYPKLDNPDEEWGHFRLSWPRHVKDGCYYDAKAAHLIFRTAHFSCRAFHLPLPRFSLPRHAFHFPAALFTSLPHFSLPHRAFHFPTILSFFPSHFSSFPLCGLTWTSLERSRSGCLKSGKSRDRLWSGCLKIGVKDRTRPDFKTLPAAHKDDWLVFLNGLSTDPRYVALLGKLRLLPPFV